MLTIRPEEARDTDAIHRLNEQAFGQTEEAELVDKLRRSGVPLISLVAEKDGQLVGHILFSPVTLGGSKLRGAGLGPLAVMPEHQRLGIGAQLVKSGLEVCRKAGYDFVIVLGHPAYYPRFGFRPASKYDLKCEFEAPDEAFMALELRPGALAGASGVAHYPPEFAGV